MNYSNIYVSAGGKKVNCPSEYKGLEVVTMELHRSPLNDTSLQRITVSQLSSNCVPGIARFRSALSAACWTETSPLSTCFSKRSRSWCMTPSCTIRTQFPSEERGKAKQVREINTMIEINHAHWEFRESLPSLYSCLDKIETVAFALFFYNLQLSRDKWTSATCELMLRHPLVKPSLRALSRDSHCQIQTHTFSSQFLPPYCFIFYYICGGMLVAFSISPQDSFSTPILLVYWFKRLLWDQGSSPAMGSLITNFVLLLLLVFNQIICH